MIKTVERKNPSRVPVLTAKWWGEDVMPQFLREAGRRFSRFEEDVAFLWLDMDNAAEWGLPWQIHDTGARDSRLVIDDWSKLDTFI